MTKQLQNVSLDEVSLVDEPASPNADILLAKSKAGKLTMKFSELLKTFSLKKALSMNEAKRAGEVQESVWALNTSLNSILSDESLDDGAKASKIQESIDQFLALISNPQGEDDMSKAMTVEEKAKAYDDMKAKETEANKALGSEDMKKALAEKDTLANENAELKKRLAEQEAKVAEVIEKQEGETRLAKARDIVKDVPAVKAEDMAKVLKGMTAEQQETLQAIVKTLGEQVKAGGLFKAVGSSSGEAADAHEQLKKKADEIAKNEKVTIEKAFTLASERNPDLYAKTREA